jgi:hypothetical protein
MLKRATRGMTAVSSWRMRNDVIWLRGAVERGVVKRWRNLGTVSYVRP